MAEELHRYFSKEDIQGVNRHMKRCSTLIIREIQIKTMRSLHTCQKGYYQKEKKQQVLMRIWRKGALMHCQWGCKLYSCYVEEYKSFSKIELPYNPAISCLGIFPKEKKTLTQKDICTLCSMQYLQ